MFTCLACSSSNENDLVTNCKILHWPGFSASILPIVINLLNQLLSSSQNFCFSISTQLTRFSELAIICCAIRERCSECTDMTTRAECKSSQNSVRADKIMLLNSRSTPWILMLEKSIENNKLKPSNRLSSKYKFETIEIRILCKYVAHKI